MAFIRRFGCVLSVLVLLGLTGCSEEEPFPICGVIPPEPISVQQQGLMKVGQKVTLFIRPMASQTCGQEPQEPISVTAEIEGPSGEPVEGKISLGARGAPARLEFTPVRPGPHHLLVAFADVGGLHQMDLHAVVDSSAAAATHTLQRPCASLERTLQGAWACDTEVIRGQTVLRFFSGGRLAVAGDVIWAVSALSVQRYVDTGTDLVLTGSVSHSQGAATFLLASEGELAVAHETTLALYTFSGGILVSGGAEPWSRPTAPVGSPGPYGVLLREGNRLAVVTRTIHQNESAIQVCPYQLGGARGDRGLRADDPLDEGSARAHRWTPGAGHHPPVGVDGRPARGAGLGVAGAACAAAVPTAAEPLQRADDLLRADRQLRQRGHRAGALVRRAAGDPLRAPGPGGEGAARHPPLLLGAHVPGWLGRQHEDPRPPAGPRPVTEGSGVFFFGDVLNALTIQEWHPAQQEDIMTSGSNALVQEGRWGSR